MEKNSAHLIDRVLAGDLEAYREIVRLFEADVFRVAAPIVGDRAAAEDITQETFLTAYDRLSTFDTNSELRPWLIGIARNLTRNELRRRYREDSRIELYSRLLESAECSHAETFSSEMMAALSDCRERLGETAAKAISGRYNEGLDVDALANKLQRSVTATRQLLYRARLALRDCIEARLAAGGET